MGGACIEKGNSAPPGILMMMAEREQRETAGPDGVCYLEVPGPGGRSIAYQQQDGSSPVLVYIHDIGQNKNDPSSVSLAKHCLERDTSFICFDLSGHGQSSEDLSSCTLSLWLEDVETVLNTLSSSPLVIVGHGLGGWLAFLYAMRNPERVFGLVGMATAADFTHTLWAGLGKQERDQVKRAGYLEFPSDSKSLKLSLELITDAEKHTILNMPGIELIQSPVWLLHGDQDAIISQSVSLHLMQKLTSPVELKVIENGSHWLCRPEDTQHLLEAIDSLLHPSDVEQDDD